MRRFALLFLASCAAPAAAAPPPVCPNPAPSAAPVVVMQDKQDKPAAVEKLSPEAALTRVITAKEAQPAWFAKVFADKVPMTQVTAIVAQLGKDLGAFQKVEPAGAGYRVQFANGLVPARIHLDEEGRIDGLFFGPPELAKPRPLAEIVAEMGTLPGKVAVLVTTAGKTEAELAPDAELAIGSAFKLAILAVIKERIDAKKLAWTQVISLAPEHKSLPSGILQEWPDGSPLTLHTLTSLMISRSDNTATDTLLDLAGRKDVEKLAPGNVPFLSTREAFVLKAKPNADKLARWRAGDEAARRALLNELKKVPLPAVEDLDLTGPMAPDVEWHFSARRLCGLLEKTHALPMLQINPGVAAKKDWDTVSYKGGSEPGVLNFSTFVAKGGKEHCVIATWNADKAVDEARFAMLYLGLLRALR